MTAITPDRFKDVLRHFASGVTIVTIKAGERVHGLTVSAFTSVSAEPPLVAVVINRAGRGHELLSDREAAFAVNILGQDDQELSNRFAGSDAAERFAAGSWGTAATGAPVLADAVAWFDCSIRSRVAAGTHTIVVGQVRAAGVPRPDAAPLLYWNRGYRELVSEQPQRPRLSHTA